MDRNREGRRATNMAALPNGLSSSRRRHRSSSLRDSPDEEGGVEVHEPGRLRDRGVVKKDRGERERERDRDRDREQERSSRSKRRRENRMINHHTATGSNRDDGDDTTSESVNEEEEDDDDDGGLRMLHQPPVYQSTKAVSTSNHRNHNSSSHPQQIHHRKSFPSSNKVFRAAPAAAPPAWKAADEMIGVSVPRKARSASTKRNQEWISGVVGVGGTGTDQIHRQSSDSPVRLASPAPAAPPSPSSSNVSVRKKMKANGGGSKPRPPKSLSKSSSSNPEELEIEIAEVLYGLMTQSQAPKKEIPSSDSNKLSSDTKSRVSSPISNSAALPQNSTSLSTVAPKRKRPRQVLENPVSSIKTEIDHHQRHQSPKTDISSPYLENNSPASAAAGGVGENGLSSFGFTTLPGQKAATLSQSSEPPVSVPQPPAEEDRKCGAGAVLTKEEVEKESLLVKLNDGNSKVEAVITTAASTTVANLKLANPESQSKTDEKFEIDLMAPPPQQRTSHGSDGGDIDLSDHKEVAIQLHETSKTREDEKLRKSDINEQKVGVIQETGESSKQGVNEEINIQLNIDLKKPNKGSASMVSGSSNPSLHQALKHPQLSAKSETHSEKTAQSSAMPMPMPVPNWPPVGYVAPLQGVVSMDGNTMASAPFQPMLTHPRPKRCATHCYIARNIHCNQQFMKMNPFWPAASGSATPMFGAKPCNLNVMPSTELHANIPQSIQDKGQAVGIFPGYTTGKDTKSSQPATITDPAQRKQQVLLQQAMPSVASNNILHGPAFIFPFNQQQAVAAASASVRPGSSKLTTSTAAGGLGAALGAANSATVTSSTTAVAPALSFNYPNINANETQYLAILQNNPYSFPMPAVGAPPDYRPSPHAQAMPLFNGSFYSSQMIHPSQVPQQPQQATPPTQAQNHHPSQSQQTHQNSSSSTSSSQKHLQAQQRPQGSVAPAVSGSGNIGSLHNSYHAVAHKSRSQQSSQQQNPHMNPALQVRHLENEVTGGEDSPSTADSRVSRAANTMSVYSHNFSMSGRSKAFPKMDHPNGALTKAAGAASANSSDKKQQQQQSQQQGLKRGGVESSLPPQTFAMSFAAPMNGTTGNISSMCPNHAIFQSLPESLRQSYMMAAPTAAAHQSQQKDFRISEEAARAGHDSSNADEDRKVSSGLTVKPSQSIAFSRPDLVADASCSNNRSSRSPISSSMGAAAQSSHTLHAQYQQQQHVLQLQKQQQQNQQQQNQNMNNARAKNQSSSNGSAYPGHLIASSSSMAAKFPNSISSFPLQTSNTSSSPVQSPQWRNPARGPTTSQVPSSLASATTTSSLKNLHQSQQQSSRSHPHPQSHTQISFGTTANQKPLSTASVQMQNQNPSSNSGNQSPSPPMLVGSPTTSVSKGVGGGTSQVSSLSSSQPSKNSPVVVTQRSSPGILGNPNSSNSTKSQQQLQQKQTLHQQKVQAMMMYSQPYMQVQQQAQAQAQQHAASSMSQAQMMMYTHPIRLQQQQQSSSQQSSSSTAMLSLCPPVTHASTTTSDPAKAIAAATSMMNHPKYGAAAAQSSMPTGFPQYVHNAPAAAAVQVKPSEQKQPAA